MDFSQTRLKLRVAVCPYVAPINPEYQHRIVGMKRDSNSGPSLVILRQFLLLLPLDCTFADLTSRVTSQYEKLYQNQPAFVPIKGIALFRDFNQCDLDLDYLVSDICSSNDLIYAMVEIEESSKKIKLVTEEFKSQKSVEQAVRSNPNQGTGQNEKKVPEFKPTPVKTPVAVKQSPVKNETKTIENITVEAKKIEVKKAEIKKVEVKPQETKVKDVKITDKVSEVKVSEIKTPVPIKAPETKTTAVPLKAPEIKHTSVPVKTSETKHQDVKVTEPKVQEIKVTEHKSQEVKVPVPIAKPNVPAPVPIKTPANKKQVEEVKKETGTETLSEPVAIVNESSVNVSVVKLPEPDINSSTVPTSYSEAVSSGDKRVNDMITPIPTSISRPIFHPRKSEIPQMSSSSDEEEVESVLNTFDATNLFGPQLITSEPRRSENFVLFNAGSSDDSNDSSDENMIPVVVPLKSSSIVSLQAAPSSELNEEESDDDEESDDLMTSKASSEVQLPHSVTLRRLSSVSPIPDPSEIPSLNELKESINRTPTPIQIVQGQQQQQQHKNFKGGRPAKKQNNTGRPKKAQQ